MKEKFQIGLTLGIACLFVMLPCAGHGASLTVGNTISMVGIDGVEIGAGSPVYVDGSGKLGTATSPGTITINCSTDPPESLQSAINAAQPGDTINVTGTCNVNLFISDEKTRLTLQGQSGAILHGLSAMDNVLNIRGRDIAVRNFEITGGASGIWVNRGGTAGIASNNIHNTGTFGIVIEHLSFATIVNNSIHDNPQAGILVLENSHARIGFGSPSDTSPSPNTIQNNGGRGIEVSRTSSARIIGNTIADNGNDGIGVLRSSQADIADNTINNNGRSVLPVGHGINVAFNGGVNLGESDASTFFGQANITATNNAGYGINCSMGGYIRAYHFVQTYDSTHPIWGASGQHNLTTGSTCPYSLTNP